MPSSSVGRMPSCIASIALWIRITGGAESVGEVPGELQAGTTLAIQISDQCFERFCESPDLRRPAGDQRTSPRLGEGIRGPSSTSA